MKITITENAILYLISQSLDDEIVVRSLKYTIIKPILNKSSLEPDILTNYRPISQLPIIIKIMERVVSSQLINCIENNNLLDYFQSAYRKSFSTETALTHATDLIHNRLPRLIAYNYSLLIYLVPLTCSTIRSSVTVLSNLVL